MPQEFTSSHAWRKVRLQILERDNYLCQARLKGCTMTADAVDHIIPPEEGGALYDPGNLRAICTHCNNVRAMRTRNKTGWRRSETHIILVVGPPGAGKSTYVAEHRGPHDLVIDYDAIAASMGGGSHEDISAARNALIRRVERGQAGADRAWIISANPKAESMFPHHDVVELDPGREVVMARCAAERSSDVQAAAVEWYRKRTPAQRREW